ncbi:MAG TPA: tetratricopeptide repeat protein [Streptosporangiaceae bacterium]
MSVLSRETFDAIEFDAACSGDHRAAAQHMTRLAATGTQTRGMPRAEAFMRAGEQWLLADEPAAAVNDFRQALADGGPSSVDPRAPLAQALFMMGQAAEAEDLVGQLAAAPPRDPRMCDLLAELMVERTDLISALAWANAGIELYLGRSPGPVARAGEAGSETDTGPATSGTDTAADGVLALPAGDRTELRLLLSLRFRIRNDLGLAEDGYDRLLDVLPPEPGSTSATGLPGWTTSASAAASRSTVT